MWVGGLGGLPSLQEKDGNLQNVWVRVPSKEIKDTQTTPHGYVSKEIGPPNAWIVRVSRMAASHHKARWSGTKKS